jgi:hypothetical protein
VRARGIDGALDSFRLPSGASPKGDHRYLEDQVEEENDDDRQRDPQRDDAINSE